MRLFSWNKYILQIICLIIVSVVITSCHENTEIGTAFPTAPYNPKASEIPTILWKFPRDNVLNMPRDEAPHHFLTEWWYYSGHVITTDNRRYGVLFMVYQFLHPNAAVNCTSYLAISDIEEKNFVYEEVSKIADPDTVSADSLQGFNLNVDGWTLRGKGGLDSISAMMHNDRYGLTVHLSSRSGLAAPGNGLINMGVKKVPWLSYYYERPLMFPTGTIRVDGITKKIKTGQLWFDHQWGDFYFSNLQWTWFSVQLDDGSQLMLAASKSEEQGIIHRMGIYIPACSQPCHYNAFMPVYPLRENDIQLRSMTQWRSPKTGTVYPLDWEIIIKKKHAIPAIHITMTPTARNAEIVLNIENRAFWEGDNIVRGVKDGKPITGSGFVELFGYDRAKQKTAN